MPTGTLWLKREVRTQGKGGILRSERGAVGEGERQRQSSVGRDKEWSKTENNWFLFPFKQSTYVHSVKGINSIPRGAECYYPRFSVIHSIVYKLVAGPFQ